MEEPLMLTRDAMDATDPIERGVLITGSSRNTYLLTKRGICLEGHGDLVLDFSNVLGVKREGTKLTFANYPKVASTSLCCTPSLPIERIRKEISFQCENEDLAKSWELSTWKTLLPDLYTQKNRYQRSFLVFVNPKSGTGKSERIFQEYVLPMFRDAGIESTLVKTEYAGHASQYAKDSIDSNTPYDGIVVIGGDGLFFEVLQGIMTRPDWANILKKLPLGIVPGGSGNGLALSLAHNSGEVPGPSSNNPSNNSFLIAKGYVSPFDLCAVDHFNKGRVYSFLSYEFGFMCDMDVGSDYMRSLGDARFTLEAIRLLFSPKSFKCRLSYIPAENNSISPKFAPRIVPYWQQEDPYVGADGPKTRNSIPLSAPIPNNWVTIEDKFYFMWHSTVAWVGGGGHISPHSRWDDGYQQLCFYRKGSRKKFARYNILRFLLALENGGHVFDEDGSTKSKSIEMFPTTMYRVEPLEGKGKTRMAIDGEEFEMGPIQVEVLPGIALLLGGCPPRN